MGRNASRRWLAVALCLVIPLVTGCLGDPPQAGAECPANTTAEAGPQGAVNLTWDPVPEAESYPILRSQSDTEPTLVANVSGTNTSFTDTSTAPATTYRYTVHTWNGTARSTDCPTAEVAPVPFFPGLAATIAIGGLVALGVLGLQKRG